MLTNFVVLDFRGPTQDPGKGHSHPTGAIHENNWLRILTIFCVNKIIIL